MRFLDCTLRDGGYYTDWNFSDEFTFEYYAIVSQLPITDIEVGYINPGASVYRGEQYYVTRDVVENCRSYIREDQNIWVMFDLKYGLEEKHLFDKLSELSDAITGVRLTIDPEIDITLILEIVQLIKSFNLQVSLNFMYAHLYLTGDASFSKYTGYNIDVDIVCIVDSFGCLLPSQLSTLVQPLVAAFPNSLLGFHGHNNHELASANALAALDSGAQCIDSTFLGLGRGAGNLKTEIFLPLMSKSDLTSHMFEARPLWEDALSRCEEVINNLGIKFGTSSIYSIAAIKKLPQSSIMNLASLNRYSNSEILHLLSTSVEPYPIAERSSMRPFSKLQYKNFALCLSASNEFKMSSSAFKYLQKKYGVVKIYLLDMNAFYMYEKNLLGDDIEATVITNFKNRQLAKQLCASRENIHFIFSPPFPDGAQPLCASTVHTISSPLEIALRNALTSGIDTIGFFGLDGQNSIVGDETRWLLSKADYADLCLFSLTPTLYNISLKNAFA